MLDLDLRLKTVEFDHKLYRLADMGQEMAKLKSRMRELERNQK